MIYQIQNSKADYWIYGLRNRNFPREVPEQSIYQFTTVNSEGDISFPFAAPRIVMTNALSLLMRY